MKVAICLCTYRRPVGLRRQLRAVAAADKPTQSEIIVVDNACEEATAQIVMDELPQARLIYEPRRGISFARNASFHAALQLGAGLLATIDDDDEVTQDWLLRLLDHHRLSGADLVLGTAIDRHGRHLKHVRGCCNALFSRRVLLRLGPLWFDPSVGLTGGEDAMVFEKVVDAGGSVARCVESRVRRHYAAHRATLYGRFLHGIRFGQTARAIPADHMKFLLGDIYPDRETLPRRLGKFLSRVNRMMRNPWRRHRHEQCALEFGRVVGILLLLLNRRIEYYGKQTAERS